MSLENRPVSFEEIFHKKVVNSFAGHALDRAQDVVDNVVAAFSGATRGEWREASMHHALRPDAYDAVNWDA